VFSPLFGTIFIIQAKKDHNIQNCALWINAFTLLVAMFAFFSVDFPINGFDLVEQIPWLAYGKVYYHLGVDNLSIIMIILITSIFPVIAITSLNSSGGSMRSKMMIMLCMETCILLSFCAMDIIVFFVSFWAAHLCFLALAKTLSPSPMRIAPVMQFATSFAILLLVFLKISDLTSSYSLEIIRYELTNSPLSGYANIFLIIALFIIAYSSVTRANSMSDYHSEITSDFTCRIPMLMIRMFLMYRFLPLAQCAKPLLIAQFFVLFFHLKKLDSFTNNAFNGFRAIMLKRTDQPVGTPHSLEQIVVSFVLIDLLVAARPKSLFLIANYCLSFACMCTIPFVFDFIKRKQGTFASSAIILFSTGFPCWSYMCTLPKFIKQNLFTLGIVYLAGVFWFIKIGCDFLNNIEDLKVGLTASADSNFGNIRINIVAACIFSVLVVSLVVVNIYPFVASPLISKTIWKS
jgi:hypothetical protein